MAYLKVINNESASLSYIVILQFQDNQGYVTQIDYTQPIIVEPSEEMQNTIEYTQESGKRLVDIFV